MNLVGRYERVRPLGPGGWGLPYVLDRKHARFAPYKSDEWAELESGLVVPQVRGGIGFGDSGFRRLEIGYGLAFNPTFNTFALNTNYTAGTAGRATSQRFLCPVADTITDIYFNISAYAGTAALVDDINWEIRSGTIAGPTTTGGALLGSGTINPSSATGWIKIAAVNVAIAAGYNYAIIADADGGGGNSATLMSDASNITIQSQPLDCGKCSTTDGFVTPTISNVQIPAIVIVLASGRVVGMPFSSRPSATSSTNRKGLVIDGLAAPMKLQAMLSNLTSGTISGLELYAGTGTVPGTSPVSIGSVQSVGGSVITGYVLAAPYLVPASTPYRFVFTYSGAAVVPNKWTIGTGADANLRACMIGKGLWNWAEANGTTNWNNDDTNVYPDVELYFTDPGTPAPLLGYGLLSGGGM